MLNKHETPVVPPKDEEPAKPPVMDVRPPEHSGGHSSTPAHSAAAAKSADPDTVENPQSTEPASKPVAEDVVAKPPAAKAVPTVKTPRQPGVTMAIIATVVIVLGLALLAVYAYLRTNNTSLL